MFVVGHSTGGTAAMNFALAHPEQVEAVAALSPKPDIFPATTITVPILIAMNARDWGIEQEVQTFLSTMKGSQAVVSKLTFPMEWGSRPTDGELFQHTNTARTQQLTGQWVAEVAALRRKFKGVLPPMTKWPFAGQAEDPTRPLDKLDAPAVYLPSTAYRDLLKGIPRQIKLVDATGPTHFGSKAQVRVAQPGDAMKQIGVALVVEDQSTLDEKEALWDGLYLADNAVTAVVADRSKLADPITTLMATVSTYDKTGKTPLGLLLVDPSPAELAGIRKKVKRTSTAIILEVDPISWAPLLPEVKKAIQSKFSILVLFRGEVPADMPPEVKSKKVEVNPSKYSERKQHHLRLVAIVEELNKQAPADKLKAK